MAVVDWLNVRMFNLVHQHNLASVDFFKREAEKHDTKYQQMIRRLLDAYTRSQDERPTSSPK